MRCSLLLVIYLGLLDVHCLLLVGDWLLVVVGCQLSALVVARWPLVVVRGFFLVVRCLLCVI